MQENEKYFSNWSVPKKLDNEASWTAIQNKIAKKEATIIPLYRNKWIGIAASLALLLAFVFFFQNPGVQTHVTLSQQKEMVILPDGSKAHLNAGSKIVFNANNWEEERVVNLSGEAFFEVKKGESFQVVTKNGMVEVLGTSFNVFDRKNMYHVSCKTGKVKVSVNGDIELLTPGLKTALLNERLTSPYTFTSGNIAMWLDQGQYHFDNVPLSIAFEELERQFGIKIDTIQLDQKLLVNADIPLESCEVALNILSTAFDLEIVKNSDEKYTVTKK